MTDQDSRQGFPVRVDFDRILETIAARIYDSEYAFLRENVQNAIDAVRIQALRDGASSSDSRYRIEIGIEGKVCTIKDNGIGMTKDELINNFWTMGASGKTTAEAKAAGCIGMFGIGGFANFGVCDTLEVISRSNACTQTHHTSLSRSAFRGDKYNLPMVGYAETDELNSRGTIVRGISISPFNATGLVQYLRQFVRYVSEPVFIQGKKISQEKPEPPGGNYRTINHEMVGKHGGTSVAFQLFADEGNNLSANITSIKIGGQQLSCNGYVRLVHGQVNVYKRGFRICAVTISSRIGIDGSIDCDMLQPTAGRDSLDTKSQSLLNQIFKSIESSTYAVILEDSELLANHVRLLPDLIGMGYLERLGPLSVTTVDKRNFKLEEIRKLSSMGRRVFYSYSGRNTSAAEVLQARGGVIIALSSVSYRRSAELQYLESYCKAKEFDNLIECVEPYEPLDIFDRVVLAELDRAIKRLFNPPEYKFVAGKLSLDVPIYWSATKDGAYTVVFVDTRHGEFLKLKPLGYSALFWSMIEAFCREYLGDTLKKQSPKFFGSGAIDLEAYSKSHAELWELIPSDIQVSTISSTADKEAHPRPRAASHFLIVRTADVVQVTISESTGVTTSTEPPQADTAKGEDLNHQAAKLLRVIDETHLTGLDGYYLRIPETATEAFGELIRTFPSFAVVWFANHITWQGSDLKNTAFLFDVTLDRLIGGVDAAGTAHGAMELGPARIQNYNSQLYFYIPPTIQDFVVPKSGGEAVRIEIRHELIDLDTTRSWTSKDQSSQ